MTKLTKGQREFLKACYDGRNCSMHTRVMKPLWDAGYIFPRPGNLFAWIVGCNGQNPADFALQQSGYDVLVGQSRFAFAS